MKKKISLVIIIVLLVVFVGLAILIGGYRSSKDSTGLAVKLN